MDLQTALNTAVANLVASGQVEKLIEKKIAETVEKVIDDSLRSYSPFGEKLKKIVAQAFSIEGREIDLPSYNDMIIKIIRANVQKLSEDTIQRQVADRMEELLEPAPKTIKLSALVERFVSQLRDERDAGCVCHGDEEACVKLESSSMGLSSDREFKYLKFWEKQPDRGGLTREQPKIAIGLYKGEVFSLKFAGSDVEKMMFVGPLFNFERFVFQMKVARTIVEIDCDPEDCDLSYGDDD